MKLYHVDCDYINELIAAAYVLVPPTTTQATQAQLHGWLSCFWTPGGWNVSIQICYGSSDMKRCYIDG